jgi:hypothetical protein
MTVIQIEGAVQARWKLVNHPHQPVGDGMHVQSIARFIDERHDWFTDITAVIRIVSA